MFTIMNLSRSCRFLACCILVIIFLSGCHPSPRDLTVVSGKTVYGDLALEDVHIQIHKWEEAGWLYISDSRSGYHGTFRIHLPTGTYRITASKTIRVGKSDILVTGTLEELKVEKTGGRIDQVVILMAPAREP